MKSIAAAIFLVLAIAITGCDSLCNCDDASENRPPEIQQITTDTQTIVPRQRVWISVVATDPDGDTISYNWSSRGGTIQTGGASDVPDYDPTTNPARWQAPEEPGSYTIICTVNDGVETSSDSIMVTVNSP